MSQAEYARHRGVTRQAVSKDVKAGRIPVLPNGRINPADADFARGATQQRAVVREEAPAARGPMPESRLTAAKTAEAMYDTRIKQLKYEQMRGNLVPVADVVNAAISCSEVMLRSINLIAAYAEQLVGKDLIGARAVLKSIDRDLRQAASGAFTQLAAEAKAAAAAGAEDEGETGA